MGQSINWSIKTWGVSRNGNNILRSTRSIKLRVIYMYKNTTPRWRENELSVNQFQWLESSQKKIYVESLLLLKPEEISFNDEYILHFYTKNPPEQKQKNFFTIDIE